MKGFKDFLMQGNLIELATAVIIGTSFATVVSTFTNILLSFVGMFGGVPDFSAWAPAGLPLGIFLNAVISFVIVAAVIYFLVIKPYQAVKAAADARLKADSDAVAPAPTTDELLAEIRDLLKANRAL
ncbi:large conductance mechanosensitive channel protein MscL [Propioniciclava soli]|uniref:Large conductance mechanosensitive channel protein MscL n=1 Tax=Propioniciclava soli TaxID=2775081 RepID=A0ABZ3CBS5_9ACTN|nr:large conductance mechanosensitive channel protein MscL [Propioniciclava soli]